jgi:hypothetical protein
MNQMNNDCDGTGPEAGAECREVIELGCATELTLGAWTGTKTEIDPLFPRRV